MSAAVCRGTCRLFVPRNGASARMRAAPANSSLLSLRSASDKKTRRPKFHRKMSFGWKFQRSTHASPDGRLNDVTGE